MKTCRVCWIVGVVGLALWPALAGCVNTGCKDDESCGSGDGERSDGGGEADGGAELGSRSDGARAMDAGARSSSDGGSAVAEDGDDSASNAEPAEPECPEPDRKTCYADVDGDGLAPADAPPEETCGECLVGFTGTAPAGDAVDCNDELVDRCDECESDDHCGGLKPMCGAEGACIECAADEHCSTTSPICDQEENVCVECLAHRDCQDPKKAICSEGACVGCEQKADCEGIRREMVDLVACAADGECVRCTDEDESACGNRVCDTFTNTCGRFDADSPGAAQVCEPCLSSSHCADGLECVQQMWEGDSVGWFCLWGRDATGTSLETEGPDGSCGPDGDTRGSSPFSVERSGVTTLGGATVDVCDLELSTCAAYNVFRGRCESRDAPDTPDHSRCGFDPPNDGFCVSIREGGTWRCSLPCNAAGTAGANQCPRAGQIMCEDTAEPPFCDTRVP